MKKRIFTVAMVAMVLAIALVGATTAYFTDTKSAVNVFTVGSVEIRFTELDADGDEVEIGEGSLVDYGLLYPGRVISKKPTVTVTGNESAFVAAHVVITNDHVRSGEPQNTKRITDIVTDTNVMGLFQGGIFQNGGGTVACKVDYAHDAVEVLVVVNSAVSQNETAVIFEDFMIPATWNNEQMQYCNGLEVTVEAYAVQTAGFNGQTAVEAVKTAFPDAFAHLT